MEERDEKLLTPPEFARRLGVSPKKVRAWIRSQQLTAINVASNPMGRAIYKIRPTDAADFERRREQGKPQERRASKKRNRVKNYFAE